MNKIMSRFVGKKSITNPIILALIIAISFVVSLGLPNTASAGTYLEVMFETGAPPSPMFSEANFLPGDTVTRWAKVTNKTAENQEIVAKLGNYSNPDGLGDYFDVVVKEHGSAVNLFTGTMSEFAGLSELVLNASLAPNVEMQYDFSVTFRPETGNPYQEKVLSFDFNITLQGEEAGDCVGADCGGGTIVTYTSSSGGGGGSYYVSISGVKFNDANRNGVQDIGEGGLSGWQIYLDSNSNGQYDSGEPMAVTDGNGKYAFSGLAPGQYVIREIQQPGWTQIYPNTQGNSHAVNLAPGQSGTDLSFGNVQGEVAGISTDAPVSLPQILGAITDLPRTGAGMGNLVILFSLVSGILISRKFKIK